MTRVKVALVALGVIVLGLLVIWLAWFLMCWTALHLLDGAFALMGFQRVPPVAQQLEKAIASGDQGEILRTFSDVIYDRYASMDKSIPPLKRYLDDSDPFVRYLAAEDLYLAGERSAAFPVLDKLIRSENAMEVFEWDVRERAIHLLAKFRDTEGRSAALDFYKRTKIGRVRGDLVKLGCDEVLENLGQRKGYYPSSSTMEACGMLKASSKVTLIEDAFANPRGPYHDDYVPTKLAAAWALTRIRSDPASLDYIATYVENHLLARDPGGLPSYLPEVLQALKYLGTIDDDRATKVLEMAAKGENPHMARVAVANLIINKPGKSEVAKQVLLREIRNEIFTIGVDLTCNLAVYSKDSELCKAAAGWGGDEWRFRSKAERAKWPIWSWAADYIIILTY